MQYQSKIKMLILLKRMRGDITKYLYIDSEVGDGKISLPPMPFSAAGNERMSLTLINFTMSRRWPRINPTNNTFYIYQESTDTYREINIPIGDYLSYEDLRQAIDNEIDKHTGSKPNAISTITSIDVAYVPLTRTFSFTINSSSATFNKKDLQIRCFHLKDGAVPSGVSRIGSFSDVHEILGGRPLKDASNLGNSLDIDINDKMFSRYPASLSTNNALFLRFNLDVGQYESPGLDFKHKDHNQLQHSNIFARIPMETSDESVATLHQVISYDDTNDTFQLFLPQKDISHLQIFVTDKRNRSLTQFDAGQVESGLMNFNVVLRWDKFIYPRTEEPKSAYEGPIPPMLYPPQYGYGMARI